mmetsp:Transcript_7613/g.11546  ORF Transcript_7613/g.11546 Transcript_7613/m.11546 type:complete len:84 (+) Transcript_7613:1-252(+)
MCSSSRSCSSVSIRPMREFMSLHEGCLFISPEPIDTECMISSSAFVMMLSEWWMVKVKVKMNSYSRCLRGGCVFIVTRVPSCV